VQAKCRVAEADRRSAARFRDVPAVQRSAVPVLEFAGRLASAARRPALLVLHDRLQRDWQRLALAARERCCPQRSPVRRALFTCICARQAVCSSHISLSSLFPTTVRSLPFLDPPSYYTTLASLAVVPPSCVPRTRCPARSPHRRCRCHRSLAYHCAITTASCCYCPALLFRTPSSRPGFLVRALHAHDSQHVSAATRPRPLESACYS
jgi:hypothetical protein